MCRRMKKGMKEGFRMLVMMIGFVVPFFDDLCFFDAFDNGAYVSSLTEIGESLASTVNRLTLSPMGIELDGWP